MILSFPTKQKRLFYWARGCKILVFVSLSISGFTDFDLSLYLQCFVESPFPFSFIEWNTFYSNSNSDKLILVWLSLPCFLSSFLFLRNILQFAFLTKTIFSTNKFSSVKVYIRGVRIVFLCNAVTQYNIESYCWKISHIVCLNYWDAMFCERP